MQRFDRIVRCLTAPSEMRSCPRLLISLLALGAIVVTILIATTTAQAADADTETIELEPGNNFVGWVAEPIAVADIFEQVPDAKLIYTWSADSSSWRYAISGVGGSLDTLDSGMAAVIWISGSDPVEWERPLTPAKGMVTLYSGENWVTWNGRDEWPLDQVARGIGKSLVSIEVRGLAYQPNSNIADAIRPLNGDTKIHRGDALRVTVNRDLRWLQPTGMMPNIVWVGDISESVREEITADIRRVVDLFAEEFAVETDFSDTTVMLYNGIDAAVEHEGSMAEPSFGYSPDWLRGTLLSGRTGQARPWGFFMSACGWLTPSPQPCHGQTTETIAHEWFHVFQIHLSGGQDVQVSPVWMNEGSATWAEWQLPNDLRNNSSEGARRWRLDRVIQTTEPLESAEDGYYGWEYDLGSLAADRLVERSGADALLEYSRQVYPQLFGQERRWIQRSTWQAAFEAAFGLTAAAFYQEFEAWRKTLPEPTKRKNYDPNDVILTGTLHHSDSSPATGFIVIAEEYEGEITVGVERSTIVDEEGTFTLFLAPETIQRIRLKRAGCQLWLTDDGLTVARLQPGEHLDLDTRNLTPLHLTLPEGTCENELRARAISLRNDERPVQVLLIDSETYEWTPTRRGSPGTLIGFAPKPGKYRVWIRLANCGLWYSEGGLVASRQDGDVFELSDQPVSIEFRIPHDLCVHQISGRLLYEDGTAVEGVWLTAYDGGAQSSGQTSAFGDFMITVPVSGDYGLHIATSVADCYVTYSTAGATTEGRQATPITVADEDVTGIQFVVPDDPASLCR